MLVQEGWLVGGFVAGTVVVVVEAGDAVVEAVVVVVNAGDAVVEAGDAVVSIGWSCCSDPHVTGLPLLKQTNNLSESHH